MINYIIQVILFQVLFLAIYDFVLSKETFFLKNRWYLLSTPILSFLLPFVKIPMFQKAVPEEVIVYLPEIFLSPEKVIQKTSLYQSVNYIDLLFVTGVVLFTVLFFIKFFKIIKLIRSYRKEKRGDYTLIHIPNQTKAFSFFNYIFLGEAIPGSQKEKIIEHELVHSKQKHSLDLLFFEFLKIIMWFNPMIFIYQKRIMLVHEYISDKVAAKNQPKENYINHLLSNFFQVENISFINQFYKQSFIKKRIIMITKTQSKKMNQLKYLVLIPALVGMLFYTSCSENELKEEVVAKKELQTTYFELSNGLKVSKGENETYLDFYIGTGIPEGIEVNPSELTKEEKFEYDKFITKSSRIKETSVSSMFEHKLFRKENGRKTLATLIDFTKMPESAVNEITETEEVSFMSIDKVPTFPGCEEGDKKCFSKMVQKHFAANFNSKLPNELNLSSGKKKIFIGFKIDINGNVIDIQARAPHEDIKEEVIRVMELLPEMIPGENNGEKVGVRYSIPFTIIVE